MIDNVLVYRKWIPFPLFLQQWKETRLIYKMGRATYKVDEKSPWRKKEAILPVCFSYKRKSNSTSILYFKFQFNNIRTSL